MMENEQEWIEWAGGICPVPVDTMVDYRLRRFQDERTFRAEAGLCRWDHGRTPESAADTSLRRNDIIAYRVISDPQGANPHAR